MTRPDPSILAAVRAAKAPRLLALALMLAGAAAPVMQEKVK